MTEDNGISGKIRNDDYTGTDKRIRVCMMMPKFHIGGAEMQVMGLLRNMDRFNISSTSKEVQDIYERLYREKRQI